MADSAESDAKRYVVFSVSGRHGDQAQGTFLGAADTICEIFAAAGAAIEDDEERAGTYVCLVIKDQGSYRTWTITPNL